MTKFYKTICVSLLFISIMLVIAGCSGSLGSDSIIENDAKQNTDGEEETAMDYKKVFSDGYVPPIDQDIPQRLETATLAMG